MLVAHFMWFHESRILNLLWFTCLLAFGDEVHAIHYDFIQRQTSSIKLYLYFKAKLAFQSLLFSNQPSGIGFIIKSQTQIQKLII